MYYVLRATNEPDKSRLINASESVPRKGDDIAVADVDHTVRFYRVVRVMFNIQCKLGTDDVVEHVGAFPTVVVRPISKDELIEAG